MDLTGLTSKEVKERMASGDVNSVEQAVSRTYKDIIVKNVCTTFNLILFGLGAALLILGEPMNAMAATGIILLNVLVATLQEIKAKRRLDKIALLLRPKVTVLRDGEEFEIDQSKIVKDDIIHLEAGDQALVDGELLFAKSLELDESLLTGESSTVRKKEGDEVYSGSFCVTGDGYFKVTKFGADSFASKMLSSAKEYNSKNTPLQMETSAITKLLISIAGVYMVLVVILAIVKAYDLGAIINSAIIVLDIVPIALFLLIVITYMIAAVRMADGGVLLQRSNAVESLSHVDTVCMDKTGTITNNNLVFRELVSFDESQDSKQLIGAFATVTGSKNRTIQAISKEFGNIDCKLLEEIQFSSERKYSAVRIEINGVETSLFMGAWSSLKNKCKDSKNVEELIENASSQGLRNVVFCTANPEPLFDGTDYVMPELKLLAIVNIEDEVRPDCRETIGVFLENGMDLKVISGDNPETVDALFTIAKIPGERKIISGEELDALSGDEKTKAILETNIFGRMKPDHKQEIISTLKNNGRYVAMVGDGVNDVKSLKEAQVGISMQSGSGATRGVADMVLIDDAFSALPRALVEGRKTVSGMRDILKIYITRNFILAFLVFAILIVGGLIGIDAIPLLVIQNLYYAFLTVSVSAFLLAIWAKPTENKGAILPDVLRYALPMALLISFFAMAVYIFFWIGTTEGLISIQYTAEQLASFGWPTLTPGDPAIYDINRIAEINARNAMLVFLVLAGISQLALVAPRWKFMSIDGRIHDDYRPMILMILLFALVCLVYNVPWFCDNIAFLTIFPPVYAIGLILYTVVWFVLARFIMRKFQFKIIVDRTLTWFNKSLDKLYKD